MNARNNLLPTISRSLQRIVGRMPVQAETYGHIQDVERKLWHSAQTGLFDPKASRNIEPLYYDSSTHLPQTENQDTNKDQFDALESLIEIQSADWEPLHEDLPSASSGFMAIDDHARSSLEGEHIPELAMINAEVIEDYHSLSYGHGSSPANSMDFQPLSDRTSPTKSPDSTSFEPMSDIPLQQPTETMEVVISNEDDFAKDTMIEFTAQQEV